MTRRKTGGLRRELLGHFGMSRRAFIKLAGFAVAALAASRLIKRSALGSIVPSPEKSEGEGVIDDKWTPTSCLNCATRCATE